MTITGYGNDSITILPSLYCRFLRRLRHESKASTRAAEASQLSGRLSTHALENLVTGHYHMEEEKMCIQEDRARVDSCAEELQDSRLDP